MKTVKKFWVPRGVSESLKLALSVPGTNPPKTIGEHLGRLEDYLVELAQEEEEANGEGEAFHQAYEVVPDQTLFLEGESACPETVVQILMASDLMTNVYLTKENLGPGIKNPSLQPLCREMPFQERLVAISRIWE